MPEYEYTAYNSKGQKVTGSISSEDMAAARQWMAGQDMIPVQLAEKDKRGGSASLNDLINFKPGVKDKEEFFSSLSLLLRNGVKLDRALGMIVRNIENRAFKKIVRDVYENVRQGYSFLASLEKFPDCFDRMILTLVEVGEQTGKLGNMMEEASVHMKFRSELRSKLIQSATYPSVILVICIICILLMFNFIIPRFGVILEGVENQSIYTSFLLAASEFIRAYQFFILPFGAALIFGCIQFLKNDAVRGQMDQLLFRLPVVNNVVLNLELLRFSTTMHILLKNHLQIDKALSLAVKAVNNRAVQVKLDSVVTSVKQGASLTKTLTDTGIFPVFFHNLVLVGEETGNMAGVFNEVAEALDKKFNFFLQRLLILIEPLAIIIMAAIVGSFIVVIMMNIVSIYDVQF